MKKKKLKKPPFKAQLSMAATTATLDVTGHIGWDTTALTFTDKVQQAKEAGCTSLIIRINSLGGHCYEGLAIGDCIRNCGMETTAIVYGTAQSMGSYILQCAGKRIAHKNATIMFHQPSAGVCGTVDEILTQAQYLCGMRDRMFEDMGKRCGMSGAELSAEHMTMKIYTAEEALARGFLDEVSEPDKEDNEPEKTEPMPEEPEQNGGRVFDISRATMALSMDGDSDEDDDTEPAEPTEPAAPAKPTEPAEPTEPAKEPAEPTEPAKEPAPAEPAPAPAEPTQALTEARIAEMLNERDARLMAQMGVRPGALPAPASPAEVAAPAAAAPAVNYTMEQLDAMPWTRRLAVLDANPSLAAAYYAAH